MQINENKKNTTALFVISLFLFGVGYIGRMYYGMGESAVLAMFVAVFCLALCIRKIYKVGFLLIEDDGFSVQNGKKNIKFYFKDIDEIGMSSIGEKQKVQILKVAFKKNRFVRDDVYGFVQPLNDNEMTIFNRYELEQTKICEILRKNLKTFKKA